MKTVFEDDNLTDGEDAVFEDDEDKRTKNCTLPKYDHKVPDPTAPCSHYYKVQ